MDILCAEPTLIFKIMGISTTVIHVFPHKCFRCGNVFVCHYTMCLAWSQGVLHRSEAALNLSDPLIHLLQRHTQITVLSFHPAINFSCFNNFTTQKNASLIAALTQCMSTMGQPSLHQCCFLHLCWSNMLAPVCHSLNPKDYSCQLRNQSYNFSEFYCTYKVFISITLVIFALNW